jgi:hypothetical protein
MSEPTEDVPHPDEVTVLYMSEQASMIEGHKVMDFHIYWNDDHDQWEIGDCPFPNFEE